MHQWLNVDWTGVSEEWFGTLQKGCLSKIPALSLLGTNSRETLVERYQQTGTKMFMALLFVIAKADNNLSVYISRIDKLRMTYSHNRVIYSHHIHQ